MIIVGIHGAIGHGKTTFADLLQELEPNSTHIETSAVVAEVLDELHRTLRTPFSNNPVTLVNEWFAVIPRILENTLHAETTSEELIFTESDVRKNPAQFNKLLEHASSLQKDPELATQKITAGNKHLYRAGLQGFGGYLVSKVSPTIWYDEIVRRAQAEQSKAKTLVLIGGLRYPADAKVIRSAGGVIIEIVRPDTPEQYSQDPTEAHRQLIVSDTRIVNNGSIKELRQVAESCLSDISARSLKPTYTACT